MVRTPAAKAHFEALGWREEVSLSRSALLERIGSEALARSALPDRGFVVRVTSRQAIDVAELMIHHGARVRAALRDYGVVVLENTRAPRDTPKREAKQVTLPFHVDGTHPDVPASWHVTELTSGGFPDDDSTYFAGAYVLAEALRGLLGGKGPLSGLSAARRLLGRLADRWGNGQRHEILALQRRAYRSIPIRYTHHWREHPRSTLLFAAKGSFTARQPGGIVHARLTERRKRLRLHRMWIPDGRAYQQHPFDG